MTKYQFFNSLAVTLIAFELFLCFHFYMKPLLEAVVLDKKELTYMYQKKLFKIYYLHGLIHPVYSYIRLSSYANQYLALDCFCFLASL